MNVLDIVLLSIMAVCLIWGAIRGLLWQLTMLAVVVLSFVIGGRLCTVLGSWLADFLNVSNVNLLNMISFVLIFVALAVGCYFAVRLLRKFMKLLRLGAVDHLLGALLGLIKGVVLCWALLLVSVNLPGSRLEQQARASVVAPQLVKAMHLTGRLLPQELRANIDTFLRRCRSRLEDVHQEVTNRETAP